MRKLGFLFFIFIIGQAYAQETYLWEQPKDSTIRLMVPNRPMIKANMSYLRYLEGSKMLAVNSYDPYLQRTYFIDKSGSTLSSSYLSSSNFMPNSNPIVFSGEYSNNRDSFNPYGCSDMTSTLIFGALNQLLPKLRIKRR